MIKYHLFAIYYIHFYKNYLLLVYFINSNKKGFMMSIQSNFIKFYNNIRLTRSDDTYKDAREKDDSIVTDMKEAFKQAGYPIIETLIVGSMSTNTAIKHLHGDYDLDRGIVISSKDAPKDPVAAKETLESVLLGRGFQDVKIKKPCVTANYKSIALHLDYPIFKYDESSKKYFLAVGKKNSSDENKKWEESDPVGLRNWINCEYTFDAFTEDEKNQYKRLVAYMKRWRDFQYDTDSDRRKHIYSIGLAVMTKNNLSKQIDSQGKANDLLALHNTIDNIINDRSIFTWDNNIICNLPTKPNSDIFNKHGKGLHAELKNKFTTLKDKLKTAIDEPDESKICEILRGCFGNDFPECEETTKKNIATGPAIVISSQGA